MRGNEKLFVCRYEVSGGTSASIEMTALVPLCFSKRRVLNFSLPKTF